MGQQGQSAALSTMRLKDTGGGEGAVSHYQGGEGNRGSCSSHVCGKHLRGSSPAENTRGEGGSWGGEGREW